MEKIALCAVLLLVATAAWAKESRTFYDEATVARMREKIAKYDWAKQQAASVRTPCAWLAEMPDQELWDFVPPPEQYRAINVCIAHDCPICGDEVNRKAGHYPWIMSREQPFKVKCPVCSTVFPSNDFQPWNVEGLKGKPETGPGYVDKGIGWLDEKDGRRYHFVAYYVFWQRWVRDILGGIAALGQAYLVTGEPIYARKCALLLTKIASQYERFNYVEQAYHEGISGIPGRISDRIWSTGDNSKMALAYDAIYPALAEDRELLAFLKAKGIEDPRALIETKMLNVMAKDVMRGFVAGNMGMHQTTLCHLAIVLDNDDPAKGPTTAEMRDWLMRGDGRIEDLLWNGFWREGLGAEASPSYSMSWCTNFYQIAALLPRLGVDIWSNPKLKKMADIGLDLTVAGKFCPSIGDSGSLRGNGRMGWAAALQGTAFTRYGDPRHAAALAAIGAKSRNLFEDYFDDEAVARAAEQGLAGLEPGTRNLGGFGLAVLESGKGENRRGLSLYYGDASGGHGHYDRLNIELYAFDRPMLPEDGYPTPFTRPNFHEWRRANTHKHYCVMVDEQPHVTLSAGDLNTLVSSPDVQLADASAEVAYPGTVSLYRRTTALVDVADDRFYVLDLFRVRGGSQHDWCFHGPPFPEFSVAGGELGPVQAKGTLAGEDVPYGTKPPGPKGVPSSGFQGLEEVRRMRPGGAWSATWRKPDEDLSLTVTVPAGSVGEVITAKGEPEAQPGNPKRIQYVLGRNQGTDDGPEGLLSRYVAVVDPHRDAPTVDGVELLKAAGARPETVGVLVRRGEEVDLVHSSLEAGEEYVWEGAGRRFAVTGEFALVTLDAQGVKRACLVNGTDLRCGDFRLTAPPSPSGKVLRIDPANNTIVVDAALAKPESLRGKVVILGNERHRTSYTITDARVSGGETTLSFGDVLFVVRMGILAKVDAEKKQVVATAPLSSYGGVERDRQAGRWLYNEEKSRGFRIAGVAGNAVTLEGVEGDLGEVFGTADGRRRFWISDIGPGDDFRIPTVTHVTRGE